MDKKHIVVSLTEKEYQAVTKAILEKLDTPNTTLQRALDKIFESHNKLKTKS